MLDSYVAKPLGRRQIDQAFPIVQTIAPDLGMERWRAFAAAVITAGDVGAKPDSGASRPRGIMTVQNPRGYIHGLFSYMVQENLRHGRVLSVDNFIVLDLFDLAGAAEALLDAMDRTAAALGCKAIHTSLPDNYSSLPEYCNWLVGCFRESGHTVETLRLCKRFTETGGPAPLPPANDLE